jgi:hypothetical protein
MPQMETPVDNADYDRRNADMEEEEDEDECRVCRGPAEEG